MRFYWLHDRVRQGQFYVHWKKGTENLADYATKHHPTKHHVAVRSQYVSNAMMNKSKTSYVREGDTNPTKSFEQMANRNKIPTYEKEVPIPLSRSNRNHDKQELNSYVGKKIPIPLSRSNRNHDKQELNIRST